MYADQTPATVAQELAYFSLGSATTLCARVVFSLKTLPHLSIVSMLSNVSSMCVCRT